MSSRKHKSQLHENHYLWVDNQPSVTFNYMYSQWIDIRFLYRVIKCIVTSRVIIAFVNSSLYSWSDAVADPGFPVGGGRGPRTGGRGPPRWLRFKNFACQNERIWTHGGGHVPGTPPLRSANVMYTQVKEMVNLNLFIEHHYKYTLSIIRVKLILTLHLSTANWRILTTTGCCCKNAAAHYCTCYAIYFCLVESIPQLLELWPMPMHFWVKSSFTLLYRNATSYGISQHRLISTTGNSTNMLNLTVLSGHTPLIPHVKTTLNSTPLRIGSKVFAYFWPN